MADCVWTGGIKQEQNPSAHGEGDESVTICSIKTISFPQPLEW